MFIIYCWVEAMIVWKYVHYILLGYQLYSLISMLKNKKCYVWVYPCMCMFYIIHTHIYVYTHIGSMERDRKREAGEKIEKIISTFTFSLISVQENAVVTKNWRST